MASNTTSTCISSGGNCTNGSDIVGWVVSGDDRGTIDVLWSCAITMVLCCWVSARPNVPSAEDKWYHRLIDKANLASIGLLGPDFLFAIAVGQLSSARRARKMFKEIGVNCTLASAFFIDMGGYILTSPDYPKGFPINAEQLFYLVKHGYVDFPASISKDMEARNSADTVSKLITLWQVFWFSVTELERARRGLPMTSLELTTLTFSLTMMATSFLWFSKPTITRAVELRTNDDIHVQKIRNQASMTTHADLPSKWYRTPLDFISRRAFNADLHWTYMTDLAHRMHLPLVSRPVRSVPWDRFPGDTWIPTDLLFLPIGIVVTVGVGASFMAAWDFYFPTRTEQLLWRACSIGHMALTFAGGAYYLVGDLSVQRVIRSRRIEIWQEKSHNSASDGVNETRENSPDEESVAAAVAQGRRSWRTRLRQMMRSAGRWARSWRNVSPEQDPSQEMPLRVCIPVFLYCLLYILCRLFFYCEDIIAMRAQPAGIYVTVNRFVPFLGSSA